MFRYALHATITALAIAIPLTTVWGQSARRQKTAPTLGERLGKLGRDLFGPIEDGSFESDPFASHGNDGRLQTPTPARPPERVASQPNNVPRQPLPATSRDLPRAESDAAIDATSSSRRRRPEAEVDSVREQDTAAMIPRRESRSNFAASEDPPLETSSPHVTKRRRTYESPERSRYVDPQQPQPNYAQVPARAERTTPVPAKVSPNRAYAGRGYAPHLAQGYMPSRKPMMDHEEPTSVHEPTPARTLVESTREYEMQTGRAQLGEEGGPGPKVVRNRHVEQPRAGSVVNSQPVMDPQQKAASTFAAFGPAEGSAADESRESMVPDAIVTDLGAEGLTLAERLAAARSFSTSRHALRDPVSKHSLVASNPATPAAPEPDAQQIASEAEASEATLAAASEETVGQPFAVAEESQPLVGIPRKVTRPQSADAPRMGEPTPAKPDTSAGKNDSSDLVAAEATEERGPAVARESTSSGPTPERQPEPHVARVATPSIDAVPAGKATDQSSATTPAPARESVLLTKQSPVLAVETIGPRNIKVGTPARYRVVVENSGKVPAEGVSVSVGLPEWADVVGANASTGTARTVEDTARVVEWRVGRVDASGRQQMTLEITARRSEPLELDVRWSSAPVKSQTRVVVQEPKLELRLDGPEEVNYGEVERFALEVKNPGNGDAEQVVVRLLPANADEEATEQTIGTVGAGATKTIDLELSALRSGTFWIKAEADGQGGLHASVAAEVLVRRAALEVAMEGPAFQYAGTEGTYRIRLTNTGNAPARNVEVRTLLPAGAVHSESTETSRVEMANGRVVWGLASLGAGEEREFELTCKLMAPGVLRPQVVCTAEDDLTASHGVETKVEALADLSLEIRDPRGPVPMGSEARYEVHIKNRGTSAAHEIDVAAFFAEGVEPTKAMGGEHRLAEGQVLFEKIAALDAGQEMVLTIFAKAMVSGNRAFRVELNCPELETILAAEESTHFYDRRRGQSAAVAPADGASPGQESLDATTEPAAEPPQASTAEPAPAVESEAPAQP